MAAEEDVILEIQAVTRAFGAVVAVDALSERFRRGEYFCILGPSGCGKTTLLRLIAGFEQPDSGAIRLHGRDVVGVPPERRDVNVVFQSYALFPHLTVRENIGFGLKMRGTPKAEIERRVLEAARILEVEKYLDRRPKDLSGGQRQRVALGRALIIDPPILLLDEPLSNLDAGIRRALRTELRQLQRQVGITTIMVTHDQEEALTMADRIVVMDTGRIAQVGTARELYDRPASKFVAEFIGRMNMLPLEDGRFAGMPVALPPERRDARLIGIRPEDVRLHAGGRPGGDGHMLPARLRNIVYLGNLAHLVLDIEGAGQDIVAEVPGHAFKELAAASHIAVEFPPETIKVLG